MFQWNIKLNSTEQLDEIEAEAQPLPNQNENPKKSF